MNTDQGSVQLSETEKRIQAENKTRVPNLGAGNTQTRVKDFNPYGQNGIFLA